MVQATYTRFNSLFGHSHIENLIHNTKQYLGGREALHPVTVQALG